MSQGHFLDLDPEFVERMKTSPKYCRVMSLASYLQSLDYGDDDELAYRMLATLTSGFASESLAPLLPLIPASHLISEFLDCMNRVARCLIRLPNDIQVEPHEISDSVDRIFASTMKSPFHNDRYERGRLKSIKEGWNSALKEFETDFSAFPFREFLARSQSDWRL